MPKVKRISKVIHPNSRKALELAAKEHHKIRNARSHQETKNKQNILTRKLLWFKDAINPIDRPVLTNDEIHALIDQYFHRFDEELEQISVKNSIGKRQQSAGQHFSREKSIHLTLEQEKNEYETSGIILPDLTNVENVERLRKWNGESNLIQTIKLKPIKKLIQ